MHLRLALATVAVALTLAGCGREPHDEADVRRAFAAEGIRLGYDTTPRRVPEILDVPVTLVRQKRRADNDLIVWVFADAAALGREVGQPFLENPRLATQGCELVTRFNVASYACQGDGLTLKRVRAAMARLD